MTWQNLQPHPERLFMPARCRDGESRIPSGLESVLEENDNSKATLTLLLAGEPIMQPEDLYRRLHKRPFEPFRIVLLDGTTYAIGGPFAAARKQGIKKQS